MFLNRSILLCVTLILMMSGCATRQPAVDYRTEYDFSTLESFAVLKFDKTHYQNPKVSELEVDRIASVLKNVFAERYSEVDKEQADFHVRHVLIVEERMRVDNYNASFGVYRGGFGYNYGYSTPPSQNTYYQQGSIIVDVLDAQTNEVLWRGTVEGKVKRNSTPEARQARITRQLSGLLAQFPPSKSQ
ncbi:DUF4136 domain-containing protein [Teredinibacter purpureus]|uniref:DUF4136 domain-containing protein n=1 Tax=Teredinibacter purpureus TaxID=2731756 RepID=UPI0005F85C80|nr:DUF4136 domain-containing protein [Teredinibacter purpureus]